MNGKPLRNPSRLSDLSPDFFADVLGVAVTAIEVEPIGVNAGILGVLARVHLSYRASVSGPRSVVVKLPTDAPPNREIGMAFKFYEREGRFYSDFAADSGLPTPGCYFAHTVPERDDFVLVLEDLDGLTQIDQETGATLDEARSVVGAVAGMHSRWWNHAGLDAFEWLPRIDGPDERPLTNAIYTDGWSTFLLRFGDALTSEQIECGAIVRTRFTDVIDHLGRAPTTIAHGDYRVDNLFFDSRSSVRPLVVIDWQLALRARGVLDVAYFLGGSMQTRDRRRYERELIDEYHNCLRQAGVIGYSVEECWDDYRWALMYSTVYPVDAGSFDLPSDHASAMVREWSTRFFTAVTDLDCLDLFAH